MEVTLPFLIFHFEPHFGHRDAWVGEGELVKEVILHLCFAFTFMSCYYYVQAHFVMFSGLLGPLFYKAVILYSLLFQNLDPIFAIKLFVVLPNLWFEKLKFCPILLMLE